MASVLVVLGMVVRFAGLAVLFWTFFKLGYAIGSLLISFVLAYTILMAGEIALLNRERSS